MYNVGCFAIISYLQSFYSPNGVGYSLKINSEEIYTKTEWLSGEKRYCTLYWGMYKTNKKIKAPFLTFLTCFQCIWPVFGQSVKKKSVAKYSKKFVMCMLLILYFVLNYKYPFKIFCLYVRVLFGSKSLIEKVAISSFICFILE